MKRQIFGVFALFGFYILSSCSVGAQNIWTSYGGNPVLTGGALDPAVLFDSTSGKYMIWFPTIGGPVRQGTSTDGIFWFISDSIALTPGPYGSYDQQITSVFVVKAAGRYLMYYTAFGPVDTSTIGLATSLDGIHWQKHPNSPVLRPGAVGSWEYPKVTASYVEYINGSYVMVYSGYTEVYQNIGIATSADGVNWTRNAANPVLVHGSPSAVDATCMSASGLSIKNGTWYLIYRATDNAGRPSYCLATSPDGTQWHKYNANPIYGLSRSAWDSYIIGAGSLLPYGSGFRFWYAASNGSAWSIGLAAISSVSQTIGLENTSLDFGWTRVGEADTLTARATNLQSADTIHILSLSTNNPVFTVFPQSLAIPPESTNVFHVVYRPGTLGIDTGSVIGSGTGVTPFSFFVNLSGHGYVLLPGPTIVSADVVPNTYYQVRIEWFRSLYDSTGAADPVDQYSIWREVTGIPGAGVTQPPPGVHPPSATTGQLWDFVQTVPVAGFERYSAVVPALIDYSTPSRTNTYMVAAHTRSLQTFYSVPDTVNLSDPRVTEVRAEDAGRRPASYSLEQNYPNPFNPSTTIRYALPRAAEVTVEVYNTLGQQVALLVHGRQDAGVYAARFDAGNLASGVYICRLRTSDYVQSRRLLLLR